MAAGTGELSLSSCSQCHGTPGHAKRPGRVAAGCRMSPAAHALSAPLSGCVMVSPNQVSIAAGRAGGRGASQGDKQNHMRLHLAGRPHASEVDKACCWRLEWCLLTEPGTLCDGHISRQGAGKALPAVPAHQLLWSKCRASPCPPPVSQSARLHLAPPKALSKPAFCGSPLLLLECR